MSIKQESIGINEETTNQETPNNLLSPKGAIVFPSTREGELGYFFRMLHCKTFGQIKQSSGNGAPSGNACR